MPPSLVLELSRVKTRHVDASSTSVELRECGTCVPRLLLSLASVFKFGRPADIAPVAAYEVWMREPLRSLAEALRFRLPGSTQLTNWQLLQNLSGLSVTEEGRVRGHFRFSSVPDSLCRVLRQLSASGMNERVALSSVATVFSDGVSVNDNVRCHAFTIVSATSAASAMCASFYLYEAEVVGYASAFYSLKVCVDLNIAVEPALCWAAAVRQGCDIDILQQHIVAHKRLVLIDLPHLISHASDMRGVFIWRPL